MEVSLRRFKFLILIFLVIISMVYSIKITDKRIVVSKTECTLMRAELVESVNLVNLEEMRTLEINYMPLYHSMVEGDNISNEGYINLSEESKLLLMMMRDSLYVFNDYHSFESDNSRIQRVISSVKIENDSKIYFLDITLMEANQFLINQLSLQESFNIGYQNINQFKQLLMGLENEKSLKYFKEKYVKVQATKT